jgi:putative ABC transport system permease protein
MDIRSVIYNALAVFNTRKLRTLLATLGMVFGVGAVIAMLAIGEGGAREIQKKIGALGASLVVVKSAPLDENQLKERVNDTSGLSVRDALSLQSVLSGTNQQYTIAWQRKIGIHSGDLAGSNIGVLAVSPDFFSLQQLRVTKGRSFVKSDFANARNVALVGSLAAPLLKELLSERTAFRLNQAWFEPVGQFQGREPLPDSLDAAILIPWPSALAKIEPAPPYSELDELYVDAGTLEKTLMFKQVVEAQLHANHAGIRDFTVFAPLELLKSQKEAQKILDLVLLSIAAISLLVGGIGIMNIMLANILERIPEIGLRRALGAKTIHILLQFLIEAMMICLLGGFMGIFFGFIIGRGISAFSGMSVVFSPVTAVAAFLISATVGLLFGLMPALRAAKIHPMDALRAER